MIRIAINGICGKMGCALREVISSRDDMRISFGIDPASKGSDFPGIDLYETPSDVPEDASADVLIDFSHFSAVPGILDLCVSRKLPVVVCTTGLGEDTLSLLKEASEVIPVFYSANMSPGIGLLKFLARKAAAFLGEDYDVEIVEMHHNRKIDAPSGTALALADAINDEAGGRYEYVYDRHQKLSRRDRNEIGISSVRGGNIVGDHEIIFAGNSENIVLSHHVSSRSVFADGAVKAAMFLRDKDPGLYDMEDLF